MRFIDVEASVKFAPEAHDLAFERLYRRYARDVYRYALAVLRNPHEAEDVSQITFMNAYRAMRRGEEPLKPKHWLIKIAHNACRTRRLHAARRPEEVPLDETQLELPVPDGDALVVSEVLDALGKLPFNQRAALVMRELEGRSYAEIAETLEMSVPAVEALLYRARRALRLRTSAIRVLGAVQLPTSLPSFSGGAAAGGVVVGSGVVLKAAVVLAAGVLAGGVGYKTVEATVLQHSSGGLTRLDRPEPAEVFSAPTRAQTAPTSRGPSAIDRDSPPRAGVVVRAARPAGGRHARRESLPNLAGATRGRVFGDERSQGTSAAPPRGSHDASSPGAAPAPTVDNALEPLPVSTAETSALPDPELPPTTDVTAPEAPPPAEAIQAVPPPPPLPELPAPPTLP